ncbi:MAG TPA: SRPBCC domain-containing protein [bacterium]|jgi:PhnB protein
MTTNQVDRTHEVEVERTYNAPIDRVWAYFTEPELMEKWAGGDIYEHVDTDVDFRVGGVLHMRVLDPKENKTWIFHGVYHEIEDRKMVKYTFDWKHDWREDPSPHFVTNFFDGDENSTTIRIKHEGLSEEGAKGVGYHLGHFLEFLQPLLEGEQ